MTRMFYSFCLSHFEFRSALYNSQDQILVFNCENEFIITEDDQCHCKKHNSDFPQNSDFIISEF